MWWNLVWIVPLVFIVVSAWSIETPPGAYDPEDYIEEWYRKRGRERP